MIRTGAFDDIDLCLAHHIQPGDEIQVGSGTGNGFVSKVIRYLGKAAHAAGAPDKGVNALSAASIGLQALGSTVRLFVTKTASVFIRSLRKVEIWLMLFRMKL